MKAPGDLNKMDHAEVETRRSPKTYMIEEEGIIKEIRGEKALVLTDRKAQCDQCTARGCCQMLGGGKEMLSEALNPIGAKVEDVVKIGIPAGIVTRASMVVYLIPAIGLVAGAALGHSIGTLYRLNPNLSTLVGSLVGIGISLILVRLLSNVLSKRPSYQLEVIRIVHPHDPEASEGTTH